MSLSRIPLQQIFRTRTASLSTTSSTEGTVDPTFSSAPDSTDSSTGTSRDGSPPRYNNNNPNNAPRPALALLPFSSIMSQSSLSASPPTLRGTRTPQMVEYERQAAERSAEADAMAEERRVMTETLARIESESARIAQEEYEMRQYYEAEALRHAEEVRAHAEEVRRHQERVREHERRVVDHEASSEAFAKVIAMPARVGRERISALGVGRQGGGLGPVK